jgi:hypothetical protein
MNLVPERGLEPPLPCENQVLNLARLPIPPFGHICRARFARQVHRKCARIEAFSFCPPLPPLSTKRQSAVVQQKEKLEHLPNAPIREPGRVEVNTFHSDGAG